MEGEREERERERNKLHILACQISEAGLDANPQATFGLECDGTVWSWHGVSHQTVATENYGQLDTRYHGYEHQRHPTRRIKGRWMVCV